MLQTPNKTRLAKLKLDRGSSRWGPGPRSTAMSVSTTEITLVLTEPNVATSEDVNAIFSIGTGGGPLKTASWRAILRMPRKFMWRSETSEHPIFTRQKVLLSACRQATTKTAAMASRNPGRHSASL